MADECLVCGTIVYFIIQFILLITTASMMINYKRRIPVERLFDVPEEDLRKAPF